MAEFARSADIFLQLTSSSIVIEMEEQFAHNGIKIPICDSNRGEKDRVVFYPDELPEDHRLLSDVLRGVFAPFKVWRRCAVCMMLIFLAT